MARPTVIYFDIRARAEPIRLILCVVSPPYDDQSYLKLYKRLGHALKDTELMEWLQWVEEPGEVVRLLANV